MIKQSQAGQSLSVETVCWVMFLLTLTAVLITRVRLLGIPLERDEGEYAYLGQLLLQGVPPYKLAYSMKLPGACAVYALLMAIFGETTRGIHLGFLIINFASVVLIFFIAKRLSGTVGGIISAVSYSLLSISQSVLGVQAHATHFVVFMALCGSILLLKAVENENKRLIFLSGLFFGLAFLMKQQGVFFIPVGIFYLSWVYLRKKPVLALTLASNLGIYIAGAGLPFLATGLALYRAGVFDKFWFWVFQYAPTYSSGVPAYLAFKIFKDELISVIYPFQPVWYIAGAGFLCLFFDPKARKNLIFIIALLVASFLAICPGLIFRQHYFVILLPVISILAGICVNWATEFVRNRKFPAIFHFLPVVIFTSLLAWSVFQQKDYFFKATPKEVSRETYGINPFIESLEIAKYLKAESSSDDTIAVLGSEPQIYFYSHRRSATGYIYAYPLMESQRYALNMQEEMAAEIESKKPRYLVFVNVSTSWLRRSGSESFIFRWANDYINKRYDKVGAVVIHEKITDYYWDADAKNAALGPSSYVLIYKRKSN